jgi:hypothetical protein
MVGIIEVPSAREPKHMKQIIIAHGLLRTHTQPCSAHANRASATNQEHVGGAALCQGACLTLSLPSAKGHLALLQIFAGRLNQRGCPPFCSC